MIDEYHNNIKKFLTISVNDKVQGTDYTYSIITNNEDKSILYLEMKIYSDFYERYLTMKFENSYILPKKGYSL